MAVVLGDGLVGILLDFALLVLLALFLFLFVIVGVVVGISMHLLIE